MPYDNNLSGALFPNDRREEGSNQPDHTGNLEINGKKWRLAAWNRQSKGGKNYLSLKVTEFEEQKARPEPAPAPAADDDFVPF